jgi:DNA-binding response OmpR family regulator
MGIFDFIGGKKNDQPVIQSKGKVLIVEDEKMLADALELKLKNEGYEVLKAENGQAGLDIVNTNKPNIILLDLMMPIMNGKQMLQKLREIPEFKTLPVIVLTNAGDADNIKETKMYYNASDFLIKSNVSPEDIVNKVKMLVNLTV